MITTTPDNARNHEQREIIEKFLKEKKDPFDRNNILKIPGNKIVAENKFWYVLKNKWPYLGSKHHFVIICKRNIKKISEMTDVENTSLFRIQKKMLHEKNIHSGAWCMRFGDPKISGTTVTRLHGHIIMPKKNNCGVFYIGNKNNLKQEL